MKYLVYLVLGLRARLASSSCAAEEGAFDACYTMATDGTHDEDPFDTFFFEDGESWSLRDCASASANFEYRCVSGPAECPAEYAAWVECGYADLAEKWDLDCEGFTYDCPTPRPTPAPTTLPTAVPTTLPTAVPTTLISASAFSSSASGVEAEVCMCAWKVWGGGRVRTTL